MADAIPDKYTAVYVEVQTALGTAVDASATAANAIEVLSVDYEFTGPGNASRSNRRNGYGGGRQPVYVGQGMRVDLTVELLPPPTPGVITNWQQYALLNSVPWAITDDTDHYDITPVSGCVESTDYESITIDIDTADGTRYRGMDGITEVKEIRGTAEGVVEMDVSVHCIYVATAAASGTAPAPVGLELPVPCIASTFNFGWHAAHNLVSSWKFIPGMTAYTPRTQNTTGRRWANLGHLHRERAAEYTVDAQAQGTADHRAECRADTARTVAIDIDGTTGAGQISITSAASGSALVSATEVVEDELQMIQCVQELFAVAGNDQFTLTIR